MPTESSHLGFKINVPNTGTLYIASVANASPFLSMLFGQGEPQNVLCFAPPVNRCKLAGGATPLELRPNGVALGSWFHSFLVLSMHSNFCRH
jgi:hypothetical protein